MTVTPESPQRTQITPREPVAQVRDLSKTYNAKGAPVQALRNVNIDFYRGEFTAIMGPSGSGKSTLMHCLAGLDAPTEGVIVIQDEHVGHMNDRQLTRFRREHLGFIFQAFNLLPTLTAEQNIKLPLELARKPVDQQWFDTVVNTVGIRTRLSHRPSELSGGQQQRVACARALVMRPTIVFADEPTGNLDSHSSADVLAFLRRSVDEFGQTIIMVTHEPSAAAYADRVVFLADGQFVAELREPTAAKVLDYMSRTLATEEAQ